MHRRHRHGVNTAPLTWPRKSEWHAGVLDFGLLGGTSFDTDKQSWSFARDMDEFVYSHTSPLIQMLPRERPWEPRPVEDWPHERHLTPGGSIAATSVRSKLDKSIRYIESALAGEGLQDDIPLLHEIISEDAYQDYRLAYYDPFMGNLCATGRFADLPVLATPSGPRGTDLAISLIRPRTQRQPPFELLAPGSTLLSFLSPICQIVTSPSPVIAYSDTPDERILVRTRESVTVIAPPASVPQTISRMDSRYVSVIAEMPSTPPSCKDVTIHAAISPHAPYTYALVGDRGRVAVWSHASPTPSASLHDNDNDNDDDDDDNDDDTNGGEMGSRIGNGGVLAIEDESGAIVAEKQLNHRPLVSLGSSTVSVVRKEEHAAGEQEDPWRSCVWGTHASHLLVASRNSLDLVDFRSATSQTSLFIPKARETIRAIQEGDRLKLAPFQTYIATSHQIACIDQRFTNRPVTSWAHHMDRAMPCGIKAMDMVSEGASYTTVLTWNRRDAEITSYNVSLGSNQGQPERVVLTGRAQELPSFHAHAQYTNSSSLRDPQERGRFKIAVDRQMQQAVKPPLAGLAVLPDFALDAYDDEINGDNSNNDRFRKQDRNEAKALKKTSVSKFSLLQYASTGALYAQEIELSARKDELAEGSVLGADLNPMSALDTNSGNMLSSRMALELTAQEVAEENEVIEMLIEAAEDNVAPWKYGVKEAQLHADKGDLNVADYRSHSLWDLKPLLEKLRRHLLFAKESGSRKITVDLDAKVEEALAIVTDSSEQLTMYDLLHMIECSDTSTTERDALSRLIQQAIELDPFVITARGQILHRTIKKSWPVMDRKIDSILRDEEPTVEALEAFLKDIYCLPSVVKLEPERTHGVESSLTTRLADLSIPTSTDDNSTQQHAAVIDLDLEEDDRPYASRQQQQQPPEGSTRVVWPTQESESIRSKTIRRLAQELLLSTTVILKVTEPDTSTMDTKISEKPTFQYLFQKASQSSRGNLFFADPSMVHLSHRCKPIWDEWKVGEDPASYVYKLPEHVSSAPYLSGYDAGGGNADGENGETDAEEIQERQERLMQLRRRREEREKKTRAARLKDPGYNINAGGSASQPVSAGVVVTDGLTFLSNPMGEADDDGAFSLPTVISASQPEFAFRSGYGLGAARGLSQQQQQRQQQQQKRQQQLLQKAKEKTAGIPKRPVSVISASQPNLVRSDGDSSGSEIKMRPPASMQLSQDRMFLSASFVESDAWATQLPVEDSAPASQRMVSFDVGDHQSQSQTQSQSQSQTQNQDPGFLWGASQPVRGPFASRKPAPGDGAGQTSVKPKKKKNRAQGF